MDWRPNPGDGEPDEIAGVSDGPTRIDAETGDVLETAHEYIAEVARIHAEGECACTGQEDNEGA